MSVPIERPYAIYSGPRCCLGHSKNFSDDDFPLVINTNRHPILYRFEVIADCYLNFGHLAF